MARETIPAEPLLTHMRTCREALTKASMAVRPFGPAYHCIMVVVTGIDALATFMTGNRDHFAVGGSVLTDQQRAKYGNDKSAS
jgi:hypothetical protein